MRRPRWHFKGTPIAGAEAFLDERLGERLTTRQLLGRYPEDIADAVVVDTPHPTIDGRPGYPPGEIVVGLDLLAELTGEKLARAVAAGLVTFAIRALEERRAAAAQGPPEALAVAGVPVGTSGWRRRCRRGDRRGGTDRWRHPRQREAERRRRPQEWDAAVGPRPHRRPRDHRGVRDRSEQVAHALRRVRGIAQVDPGGHTELVLADRVLVREGRLAGGPAGVPTRSATGSA